MAYCVFGDVNLLTNITSNDIIDADITKIIAEATKEINRLINTLEVREPVDYVDDTRKNQINGTNTTYYLKNWKGKFLADMDNDGTVDTSDVIVYQVDSAGTETKLTVSAVDHDDMYITLDSAPANGVSLYVTYAWCYKDVSTPDELVNLACTNLASAYCYGKLNIGMAPQQKWGNMKIYRDMASFEHYYKRAMDLINAINADALYDTADSTTTF